MLQHSTPTTPDFYDLSASTGTTSITTTSLSLSSSSAIQQQSTIINNNNNNNGSGGLSGSINIIVGRQTPPYSPIIGLPSTSVSIENLNNNNNNVVLDIMGQNGNTVGSGGGGGGGGDGNNGRELLNFGFTQEQVACVCEVGVSFFKPFSSFK